MNKESGTGRLEGKVAVITGATSGIGEATVDACCAEGARVVFCGRNEEPGRQVEWRQPPGTAVSVTADVQKEEDIVRIIHTAVDQWDRLDVLFNDAGGSAPPNAWSRRGRRTSSRIGQDGGVTFALRYGP